MAMIARSMGYGSNMTDAQLINNLGAVGGTSSAGTSINGIVAMANQIGANADVHGPQADLSWMDQSLAAGKKIVANGNYYDEPGHGSGDSGHYIDVVGKTSDGNYIVEDPADPNEHTFTPAQMAAFINGNTTNGGYCVAIG
jgi:hypothetical protein